VDFGLDLQIALDRIELQKALGLAQELADVADIIEIGTSVIKSEGLRSVTAVKRILPTKMLLADIKAVDGVEYELKSAFDAGADIATIMAWADDDAIKVALRVADQYRKSIMVDLLNVPDIERRVNELVALGVRVVCVHASRTQERYGLFAGLRSLYETSTGRKKLDLRVAIAGRITIETLADVSDTPPDIIIVGSAITRAPCPMEAAKKFKQAIARVTRHYIPRSAQEPQV